MDWLWTVIFLISASSVVRITGMSHWHPADLSVFIKDNLIVFLSQVIFLISV
jgi:hypothetical protein